MASDTPGDRAVSVNLPESLNRWLAEKASEEGRSREDVLLQLLSAYRKVEGLEDGDVDPPGGVGAAELEELPDALREEIDERIDDRVETRLADTDDDGGMSEEAVRERIETTESRFVDLLEDVRERVVQVKRETDAKAPGDHDHPELAATVDELDGLTESVAGLESSLDRLEDRVDAGFGNYEEVLNYLADSVDTVATRQTTLAKALVETRDELRKLAARDTARSAVESIQREANGHGIRTADCGECGSDVDVGLLSRAECPHCSATFIGVEPARGFFGSDTLETGERPALEAGEPVGDGFEYGVSEIIEADDGSAPDIDVDEEGPEADG